MRLSALHIVFFSVVSLSALAGTDLGVIGPTYGIQEEDFSKVILDRAENANADGSWNKALSAHSDSIERGALVAEAGLPQAREGKEYTLDPTITVDEPIHRADGSILYDRGTKVNPLDYVKFDRKLCFFDAGREKQVEWIKQVCGGGNSVKRIAVQGDIGLVPESVGRVYLDQQGKLSQRFNLYELPSVITRKGQLLNVEVIGL